MNILLATYPRSGQHLFVDYFKHKIEKDSFNVLESTHSMDISHDFDKKITIVRNPLDSISSWVSMEMHYENIKKIRPHDDVNILIESGKKDFLLFYNYALKNIDYFIDYELFIKYPDEVLIDIANKFGLKFNFNANYANTIKDKPELRHITSSKKTEKYEEIFSIVKRYDLKQCENLYNQALEKCHLKKFDIKDRN